jgi:hypothetical protein
MNNLNNDLIEEIRLYKRFIFLYNILVETTKLYINTVDKSKFLTGKKQNENLKFCFDNNIWALCKNDIEFLFDRLKHLIIYDNELAISLCRENNKFHYQNLGVRYNAKKETKYNAKLFMEIINDTQNIYAIYEDYFKDKYNIDIDDFEQDF